jgi:hypothetical protein
MGGEFGGQRIGKREGVYILTHCDFVFAVVSFFAR